eukprot:6138004-Pyramimonas_sp.AAC.1
MHRAVPGPLPPQSLQARAASLRGAPALKDERPVGQQFWRDLRLTRHPPSVLRAARRVNAAIGD